MSDLLLFSGGLDSVALAALVRPQACLHIDYGHRPARGERKASEVIAADLGLDLWTLDIDCSPVGSGLMAGDDLVGSEGGIEWWPFRNQLLVTFAAGIALKAGLHSVVVGSVASDGARHIDGSAAFYSQLAGVVELQEGHIRVSAPAISKTTLGLVRESGLPMSLLGWTHSCHRGDLACGWCPGCLKRDAVLSELRDAK